MYSQDMATLQAEKQAAIEKVLRKCECTKCQVCQDSKWSASGVFTLTPHGAHHARGVPAPLFTLLVRCNGCGFILHFDPDVVGADAKPTKP
jgi:hypothetical protein